MGTKMLRWCFGVTPKKIFLPNPWCPAGHSSTWCISCIKAVSNTEIQNDNDSLIMSSKVDIEGSELHALPEWIQSGVLEKVKFS